MKKIIFIDNSAHHLFGQLHLISAFKEYGYTVYALFPFDDKKYTCNLKEICECHDLKFDGKSTNLFKELKFLISLRKIYKKLRPDVICAFTIKPNLYSALVTKDLNIPVVVGITGLGTVFSSDSLLKKVVVSLYKFAFRNIGCVFFQNSTDQQIFINSNILTTKSRHYVLPGDGVDLNKFKYVGLTDHSNGVKFIFSGRLLWDKGLGELVEAIKIVRKKYPSTELIVIGNYFFGNPNAIDESTINTWHENGDINYLGMVDNVFEIMSSIDCMVLPSYYMEGLPRVLMEASSMGKPVITVDNVGCRDVVDHEITGYIAKPRDANSLAEMMVKFIELSLEDKQQMGLNGRAKMVAEFDQQIVIKKYLEVVKYLTKD